MARKPTPLREWRISIMRDKRHYLGRVVARDKEAAIDIAPQEEQSKPSARAP